MSHTSASTGAPDPPSTEEDASEITSGDLRFQRAPYAPPASNAHYLVRDKAGSERIVRVTALSADGNTVQLQTLENGAPLTQTTQVPVEALARQAARGWCFSLHPLKESAGEQANESPTNVLMRLDIQNFGRCCGDIIRANIKYNTQLIKDVGDGPFRAGDYDQAYRTFEQLAVGFNAAVSNSRREIANGRRQLTADKGKLSGREIQQRTAAFTRSEQLIHTAEREFSSILEGLRMYLLALPGSENEDQ